MSRLSVLLMLVLLTACSGGPSSPPGRSDDENRAAITAVMAELEGDRGVQEVTGAYETSMVTYGSIGLTITVADGTPAADQEALLDRAEELVWRSAADPINGLGLLVVESSTPSTAPGRQRLYQGRSDLAPLTKRYGPRPR